MDRDGDNMSEVYEMTVGCNLNTTLIDPDKQGFVDLIQGRDSDSEAGIRISKEQWALLKKSVDFCFESMETETI